MTSLSERLTRGSASSPSQVEHARRLVADWQLLADLAFADPEPVTVPGEPLAFAGGMLVRRAFLRKERLEEQGERVDLVTRAVTAAPRALGIHVAR